MARPCRGDRPRWSALSLGPQKYAKTLQGRPSPVARPIIGPSKSYEMFYLGRLPSAPTRRWLWPLVVAVGCGRWLWPFVGDVPLRVPRGFTPGNGRTTGGGRPYRILQKFGGPNDGYHPPHTKETA